MTRETCATCRFWLKKPNAEPETGFCRRKPKRYIDSAFPDFRWPPHLPSDWCGEHQPVAPAPAAPDDYTRAAVRYAEAWGGYWVCASDSPERAAKLMETGPAHDAFLRLYRERHGG